MLKGTPQLRKHPVCWHVVFTKVNLEEIKLEEVWKNFETFFNYSSCKLFFNHSIFVHLVMKVILFFMNLQFD
jgi:hypothetical protein